MKKHTLKKEKDFVQIPNSILSNPNISIKAKGVLSLMLSLPNNWNFSIVGIASKCKESRECISNAIKELEAAGYIKRTMMRRNDGKIIRKENNNIIINNTQSNPISSKNNRNKISLSMSEIELNRWGIKNNIDYEILIENNPNQKDMIDEIIELIELMVEVVCSKKETITIASDTHSVTDVKKRFMDIKSEHIEYVIECLSKNTTEISNIKQYLLATVFNAPNTIGSYYTTRVNHHLYRKTYI